MSYWKGVEDAFRLILHEGRKASSTQELRKRVEYIQSLAKQGQWDKIQEMLKAI